MESITEKEYDEIIINLTVISNLEKHKKLITTDKFLNTENENIIPECFRRWFRGDNRDEAIKKIDSCVKKAIMVCDTRNEIKDYLARAKKGLYNLIETYSRCDQTKARLETIIFNIDIKIDKD